jgi:hypothetical protein
VSGEVAVGQIEALSSLAAKSVLKPPTSAVQA